MRFNLIQPIACLIASVCLLESSASAGGTVHEVFVRNFEFAPATITVQPGDTVRWTWQSGTHTVTSGTPCTPDGLFRDPMTSADPSFEFVIPEGANDIPYFCEPHCFSGMTGTIDVVLPPVEFLITLDGFQEVSPVDTAATGEGTATFDPNTNELSWNITFQNLEGSQTGAHFHGPARPCQNAGIEIPLPTGSPVIGSQVLTAQQADDLLAGLWYVNVHTDLHTGGEIRGRVAPAPLEDPIPEPIAAGDIHIRLETVTTGLTAPNWAASPPGDSDRLFVSDQDGILWQIDLAAAGFPGASGTPAVFLDVGDRLVSLGIGGPGSFDERGLLGFAFHPDYMTNGKLYTYTSEPENGPADFSTMPAGTSPNHQTVILEWLVPNPTDPSSVVDPGSARELLRIDQPQFNHNAGCLNFGPDGNLYIALGDGGGRDDRDDGSSLGVPLVGHGCEGNGADNTTILGTILRIDPDGSDSANGRYGIPNDNPFTATDGLDEIFAYGFRNPFRFSFDSATGDLYAADVGQNHIEEVDLVVSGGNYGWRFREGSFNFLFNGNQGGYVTDRALDIPAGLTDPIAEYDHDEGIAIVGGFVYRGARIPPLMSRYTFGEFAQTFSNDGRLFYLDGAGEIREFPIVNQAGLGLSLLGIGHDAGGELYVLANETGTPFGSTGVVLRIATIPGDGDADGDVDLTDFDQFADCVTGPAASIPPGCEHMDLDRNNHVSLPDFGIFQTEFDG